MKHNIDNIIDTVSTFNNEAILLTNIEKEAAKNIIEALDNVPIMLAARTLKFCEKAIQLSKVDV